MTPLHPYIVTSLSACIFSNANNELCWSLFPRLAVKGPKDDQVHHAESCPLKVGGRGIAPLSQAQFCCDCGCKHGEITRNHSKM